jgi:hypothetical protein
VSDKKRDEKDGFWYWMTLSKPANYWLAKSLGGNAARDADRAMKDLGSGSIALVIIFLVGGGIFLILRALGLV